MKIAAFLLAALVTASSCAAQIMGVGNRTIYTAAATTWTVIQHPNDGITCTTVTCTLTNVTTHAGDLLILTSIMATATASTYVSTSGDGTWTHCPASFSQANPPGFFLQADCAYILSATGVTNGTFTFTWTAGGSIFGAGISLVEVRRSSGTAIYDIGDARADFGCTSCIGPVINTTGASDYILQFASASATSTGPGSPWTDPSLDAFVAGDNNLPAGPYQAFWAFSASSVAAMSSVAFE